MTLDKQAADEHKPGTADSGLTPLPGEHGIPHVATRTHVQVSRKGLIALAILVVTLLSFSAISVQRWISGRKPDDAASRLASARPAAASAELKRPDMTTPPLRPATAASSPFKVPAILPTDDELADPIGLRRASTPAPTSTPALATHPDDAPTVLVSSRPMPAQGSTGADVSTPAPGDPLSQTRRNLEAYQRQLQTLLDALTRPPAASAAGTGSASPLSSVGAPTPATAAGGLFGGQLPVSATPRVSAALLDDRSLILPKGTAFTCALTTKVVSATSGLIGCQVQRNVFGDDGRVLLIERGAHMDGEYRITSVKPGTVRIPVVWTRVRTPNGVVVDIDSPGTGQLGESGIDGDVDNRWPERIGAALLLSLIDDSVQLAIRHESTPSQGNAVLLPSTTSTGSKLAEKVLDSTINIPPLIYRNQGGIVGIYVARDVDFSAVYALQPTPVGTSP